MRKSRGVFPLFVFLLLIVSLLGSQAVGAYPTAPSGGRLFDPGQLHKTPANHDIQLDFVRLKFRGKIEPKAGERPKEHIGASSFGRKALSSIAKTSNRTAFGVGEAIRDTTKAAQQIVKNALDGRIRERMVEADLKAGNPNAIVQNQTLIVDKNGKKVLDPITNQGRRVDHVVIEDGKVTRIVETTSPTASKTAQRLKEIAIRDSGGEYIKDRKTGKLISIKDISSETARVDIKDKKISYGAR
ncbi:hypothetical protein GCM10010520_23320 [Rhizobium viscosum]|uniref:Uncharacterized protein n=1 Tax=Rhizobium viscosum TaxID=1673 RepID=A0ABR9IIU0_RHIVS|nr:hypothetical protein [Rhizobium viscosum]MBE1503102.1 hypothetical protein [Rhizobium viscosum]